MSSRMNESCVMVRSSVLSPAWYGSARTGRGPHHSLGSHRIRVGRVRSPHLGPRLANRQALPRRSPHQQWHLSEVLHTRRTQGLDRGHTRHCGRHRRTRRVLRLPRPRRRPEATRPPFTQPQSTTPRHRRTPLRAATRSPRPDRGLRNRAPPPPSPIRSPQRRRSRRSVRVHPRCLLRDPPPSPASTGGTTSTLAPANAASSASRNTSTTSSRSSISSLNAAAYLARAN